MLELDLILSNFFEKKFNDLSSELQETFIKLLSEADQDIYSWLLEVQSCPHPEFFLILSEIRNFYEKF